MAVDQLNRKVSLLATVLAFVGVILGAIALSTNYWTRYEETTPSSAIQMANGTRLIAGGTDDSWNGLFYRCSTRMDTCMSSFLSTTFILCLMGLVFLLVGGILQCWDFVKISDRRFVIPMFFYLACVFLAAGLFDYASWSRLNYHSSRSMVATLVFAFSTLALSAFVAGRHSTLNRFVSNGHVANGQKYVSTTTNGN